MMWSTKAVMYRPHPGMMKRCRSGSLLGMLALAGALLATNAANRALANQDQSKPGSGGQGGGIISIAEDEYKAYEAAKQETDPLRRAEKLFQFFQKYPKSVLIKYISSEDYKRIKLIEDEYTAYYAARQEADFEKRGAMLVEFVEKYPQSDLMAHVRAEYMEILKAASQGKKYELLESLAERWLKLHPSDSETCAFAAEAAMNLQKYERCGECLEAMYKVRPLPSLARQIHFCYEKAENPAKQIEWAEKLIYMPEFADDYMLRYNTMMRFFNAKNLPKAAEYAQLTLKSADSAGRPDSKTKAQLQRVRRACHHVIGSNLLEKGHYTEAIRAFERAIEAERYGLGYHEIGRCLDKQKKMEEAILYYAAAELMGGEDAPRAKARLETLYSALHNNTLVGIDKVYRKAKELLAEPQE